jgi:[ribosomal protein S18]-alanine N-acetyltransferase
MIERLGVPHINDVAALEQAAQPLPWSTHDIAAEFDAQASLWGIRHAQELIAYACWRQLEDAWWLLNIATHPAHRRRGHGERLLLQGVQEAHAHGHAAWLEVRASNAQAIALYEKHGFVPLQTRRGYYRPMPGSSTWEDACVMRRPSQ